MRSYKEMIGDGAVIDIAELLRLPKHKAIGRDEGGQYKAIEVEELPYYKLLSTKGDYIGWRKDDKATLATDYKGRKFTPDEMFAHYLHEYFAGFDHELSDEEAQAGALEFARMVERTIERETRNLGYSMN